MKTHVATLHESVLGICFFIFLFSKSDNPSVKKVRALWNKSREQIPLAVLPREQDSRAGACPLAAEDSSKVALGTSLSAGMKQRRITWIGLEHVLLLLALAGASMSTG